MDLTEINQLKQILQDNNIWPDKRMGQNFLISKSVLEKIIATADIKDTDTILEIGPGLGTLTYELGKTAKLVLGIEKDRKLVEFLRKRFKSAKNIKIVCEDILKYNYQPTTYDYKVISNLPYNITSPVINKLLNLEHKPQEMVLMVQKEVAERLCAKPGNSDRGILTVIIEYFCDAEIIEIVPRNNFYPVPDVDSAIIKLTLKKINKLTKKQIDESSFFRFVKMGFGQKRRQIHHSLSAGLYLAKPQIFAILKSVNISHTKRAEELSLTDWINLYDETQKFLGKVR